MAEILYRASVDVVTDGRQLVGLAMPWDTPALVSDPVDVAARALSRQPYLEAYSRTSYDETLRRNPEPRPLFKSHGWKHGGDPIGVAHFERAERGLTFVAYVSRTRDADEALELVNDGAMRSVSVGVLPMTHQHVRLAAGLVTLRTSVGLRELSIAPTGFGQVPGAVVEAVRSDGDEAPDGPDALALDNALRRRARRPLLVRTQPIDSPADAGTSSRLAGGHDAHEDTGINERETT